MINAFGNSADFGNLKVLKPPITADPLELWDFFGIEYLLQLVQALTDSRAYEKDVIYFQS